MTAKIKSNTELNKEIEPLYDYGEITDRDKKLIEEVINLLQNRNGIPTDIIISELKEKFKISNIPMMKIEDSIFYQLTKDEKLGMSIQGFRETTDEQGKKIRIPHIGFSSDLDYLNNFILKLIEKIKKI